MKTLSALAKKRLRKLHIKLCKELGIPPTPYIYFQRCYKDATGQIDYFSDFAVITINPRQGFLRARRTMAHETYHWYQYSKGELDGFLYKGRPKKLWKDRGPWATWPWERNANRFEAKFAAGKVL